MNSSTEVKRHRSTKADMENMLGAIKTILDGEHGQITIRHLFYRLVSAKVIEKTEAAYKGLCGHLSNWRRSGDIAWDAFSDTTRSTTKPNTWDSLGDALSTISACFRRDPWATQQDVVYVWVEKDALVNIVSSVARRYCVPTFSARGFASLSSLYEAAEEFKELAERGKNVVVYHFGDYDPSGVAAGEAAHTTLRDDFGVTLDFIRAAVTPEQIKSQNLPTRPVKQSDTRARNWTGGDSVELDAMQPDYLRDLVETSIQSHINQEAWDLIKTEENRERAELHRLIRGHA